MATTCDGNQYLDYPQQYQIAYVAGAYDILEEYSPKIAECIGAKVKISQISDTLKDYYKKNPQKRHFPCNYILKESLKKVWNCPK